MNVSIDVLTNAKTVFSVRRGEEYQRLAISGPEYGPDLRVFATDADLARLRGVIDAHLEAPR